MVAGDLSTVTAKAAWRRQARRIRPSHPAPPSQTSPPRQGLDWYQRPPVRMSRRLVSQWGPRPAPRQPVPAPRQRRWTKRRVFIVGGIAIVAIEAAALAVGLSLLGTFKTAELDVTNAEAGVAQVLADPVNGYGAESVSSVRCNGGKNPKVERGRSFTCQAVVNGKGTCGHGVDRRRRWDI